MTVANSTTVASEDHCYPSADSMRFCGDPFTLLSGSGVAVSGLVARRGG